MNCHGVVFALLVSALITNTDSFSKEYTEAGGIGFLLDIKPPEDTENTTTTEEPMKKTPPNFVFILADDMGVNDIGYNNPEVITPTLDALAEGGVKFTSAYTGVTCTPSRTSLLTGYYSWRLRLERIISDQAPSCTPVDVDMIPKYLRPLGYNSSILGKWHQGFCNESCLPGSRGFDFFQGFLTGAGSYFDHEAGVGPTSALDWWLNDEIDENNKGTFNADIITDTSVRLLEEYAESEQPFFMLLSYVNPHTPLTPPPEYEALYPDVHKERAKYLGLVTNLDDKVATVMEALNSTGLLNNTIVIFAADNGGAHGNFSDNSPYRGLKCTVFEGGSRVPMFISSPLLEKSGYEHSGMIHGTDFSATIISMAGGKMSGDADGVDQTDMFMKGEPSKREDMVYRMDMEPLGICGQTAYRKGDMKLIWGGYGWSDGWGMDLHEFYRDAEILALVNLTVKLQPGEGYYGGYRIIPTPDDRIAIGAVNAMWNFNPDDKDSGLVMFFNITADPGERDDLSEDPQYDDMIMEMKDEILRLYREKYNSPVPGAYRPLRAGNPVNGTYQTGWCPDSDLRVWDDRQPPTTQPSDTTQPLDTTQPIDSSSSGTATSPSI